MKKITSLFTVLLSICLSLNLSAGNWSKVVRGNGNVTKEVRDLSNFDGIKASAGINVYLFQGNEGVVVETDENLQKCIVTEIDDNVLKCYVDCRVKHSSKLNVYVNFKNLKTIKASSGSDVYGESVIDSDYLKVSASSAADVKIEVNAGTIDCNVSSGSDAVIRGKADHFDGSASSGADIKAEDLVVKTCKASASSGSDIRISVIDKIEARASTGADVVYYGNPDVVHISESTGGDVKRR